MGQEASIGGAPVGTQAPSFRRVPSFPVGKHSLLAEALSWIFITMASAPGFSQVIRTVQSTEQRYTCQLTFPAAL